MSEERQPASCNGQVAEHQRLARLHAYTCEVKDGSQFGERGSTRSNLPAETPPEISSKSASRAVRSANSIEARSSRTAGRSHDSPPARVTSAASMGPLELRIWPGRVDVHGNEFIARSQDRDPRARKDFDARVAASGGGGDLGGPEPGSSGNQLIAGAGLGRSGNHVFARLKFPPGSKADACAILPGLRGLDVFEHGNGIGVPRGRGPGHDFPCRAGRKRCGRRITGTDRSGDREPGGGF